MADRATAAAGLWGEGGSWRGVLRASAVWVVALTLAALAVRLYRLGGPVLRWDEGWSLAHASLPWPQLWQVAGQEWHPPAYVALLKLWLAAGKGAWSLRFLSVAVGTLTVPVAYRVAREWSGNRWVALLATGFAAFWPLLVYYGQVARMYALAALAVLVAAWFILRGEAQPSGWHDLGLVASSAVALYTLYHTAWALAGLWAYAVIVRPRRAPRLLLLGLLTLGAYLPWLLTAQAEIRARLTANLGGSGDPIVSTVRLLRPTLEGLAFVYGTRPGAAVVLGALLGLGLLLGPWSRLAVRKLFLPLLVVGASVVGTAYSARSYWFAVRHLVPAAAFLGLLLAWALARLAWRWRPLLLAALLALVVVYWPASTGVVYEKMLEVTGPFDPAEDHRYLAPRTGPHDLIYFNALARAGWYENLRRPQEAPWSYAMRWDPIVEPMERIVSRIQGDAQAHHRLWFALYKGDFGPNAPLVEWLDANLYPAGGEWQGEMLYLAYVYVGPGHSWRSTAHDERFEQGIRLTGARWTPQALGGDALALVLTWEAERQVDRSYKVFVHALDDAGQLVAQHDGIPGAGRRPTQSWPAGVEVTDRHGLLLPASGAIQSPLHIRVGLYDPETGQRLRLESGGDAVEVCAVELQLAHSRIRPPW